jgi:hypothetical protein
MFEENNRRIIAEVDRKFEVLYGQIEVMAQEQQRFNAMMERAQKMIKEPIEKEVENIKKENESMQFELQRTLNSNREVLSRFQNLSKLDSCPPPNPSFNPSKSLYSPLTSFTLPIQLPDHTKKAKLRLKRKGRPNSIHFSGRNTSRLKRFFDSSHNWATQE